MALALVQDVMKFPMFQEVEDDYPGFLGEIVTRLMPTTGLSGDSIIEEGQSNRCLYMVLTGQLDVLDKNLKCLRVRQYPVSFALAVCVRCWCARAVVFRRKSIAKQAATARLTSSMFVVCFWSEFARGQLVRRGALGHATKCVVPIQSLCPSGT